MWSEIDRSSVSHQSLLKPQSHSFPIPCVSLKVLFCAKCLRRNEPPIAMVSHIYDMIYIVLIYVSLWSNADQCCPEEKWFKPLQTKTNAVKGVEPVKPGSAKHSSYSLSSNTD